MLKLMKYEFRKQAMSKGVLAVFALLNQGWLFIEIALKREEIMGIAFSIFMGFTFVALFFVLFESVATYSSDMKNKWSYMLFFTPTTSYEIIGAKLIATIIQTFLFAFACLGLIILDLMIMVSRFQEIKELKDIISMVLENIGIFITYDSVIYVLGIVLLVLLATITMAYFSITLSSTFLANKGLKGVISFALFIGINILTSWISNKIFNVDIIQASITIKSMFYVYWIAIIVITGLGSAYMLEKKVSV